MTGERAEVLTPRVAFYRNPRVRSVAWQLAVLALVIWFAVEFVLNARINLAAKGVTSGFGFLENTAGFGISQTLIAYQETDPYKRVFLVGLLNTLLVSGLGVILATVLGFTIGIARLSSNWLVARLAGGYVELIRNLPLLFQILFWYLAVLGTLPLPRGSLTVFGHVVINNRGIFLPAPVPGPGMTLIGWALAAGIVGSILLRIVSKIRQNKTGVGLPVLWPSVALIAGLPLIAFATLGFPLSFQAPELRGFNYVGGIRIIPEFTALLLALTMYTAAFIAEVVRGGILAVSRGQSEAASSLGLSRGQTLRLIVVPQAMRVIIPPMTNQYLNLTKNSSLAVAIAYPDLVATFAGTTLNQTSSQAIEIIAITMGVYLLISIVTSTAMNIFNYYNRLVER